MEPVKEKKISTGINTPKQTNLGFEENEAQYDPYLGFALNNLCADVPWPEWSDAELNAEAWSEGKGGRATTVTGSTVFVPIFVDPQPPPLPLRLEKHVKKWKRPQEVFPGAVLTVYDPSSVDFELLLPSSHSSECNFLKVFVDELALLQFYASKYGFQVELETPTFVANTQGDTWRPWHHVYAMCKAGKGQLHKPLYCPYGKYVLRLFYMGAWRRFVVDDLIPCDAKGNCLLPITQTPGELWPILLAKGILKILRLTPSSDFSAVDFPLVSTFTGWIQCYFAAANRSKDEVWRRLQVLTPYYEQSEKNEGKTVVPPSKNINAKSSKNDSRKSQTTEENRCERFCFLMANLNGFYWEEESFFSSTVAVTMHRDKPLVKANRREGTKPWKRIRWIYWAKREGLWIDENQLPPYRRLQIINFNRELNNLVAPDPKLDTVLYEIPMEEESEAEDEGENTAFEPEQWCEYFRFIEYLTGLNILFKPRCFVCNFKVTCLKEKTMESPRPAKGTSKSPPPQNILIFPTVLKPTRNEPIFLLCEGSTEIFLCISLWVCPQKEKTHLGYLDPDQPRLLKVGRASLVAERFDWRSVSEGEIIGIVKTVGCSSFFTDLKSGRHILKLWLQSDSSYVLDISSNVNVIITNSRKIRFLMSKESQQILQYINDVSNSFIALTQKFGKPDLPAALHDFYDTIKPKNEGCNYYYRKLDEFIETFLNSILLVLRDLIPNEEEVAIMMWALRALFINPNIRCDLQLKRPLPSLHGINSAKKLPAKKAIVLSVTRTISEVLETMSSAELDRLIITIQRIFRGYRVRLLWRCQATGRKEFKPFTDRLKKICDTMFIPQRRESEVGKLLRRIVSNKPDLLTTFKFHNDFTNALEVEEFTGKIAAVEAFAWVPIARFVIACHCEGLVSCAFYLSCNLEQSVVQGFDNDSQKEIFRVTNTVSPHYYHSNVRGYTILVCGWNDANVKTVNWRLEMVKMKHFQTIHLCNLLASSVCLPYPMPNLDVIEVKNFYIPNTRSRIFRCLIKIQKRTLLTLRLSLSYSYVKFVLVVSLDERFHDCTSESIPDRVVAEVSSTNGAVIIPSLLLEYVEHYWDSNPDLDATVYVVEAYVLNDSWPLTKQEWGLVEPIRVNGENWKDSTNNAKSKRSESRKKIQRSSRKGVSEQPKIENPFWLLQALNDSPPESGESPIIEEDRSYAEGVKAMKVSWEEEEPGRRHQGRELRKKFLYMMYLEQRKNNFAYGEDEGEESWNDGASDEPQAVVDRLSSFTYLINDPSPVRYNHSPRVLPKMPLRDMFHKYRKDVERSVLSSSSTSTLEVLAKDSDSLREAVDPKSRMIDTLMVEMQEERIDFLRETLHYRNILIAWQREQQDLSNRLMEQAYETRANVLGRMLR